MTIGFALIWGAILAVCWLGWQLLRQNGRLLLRLDGIEQRLNELGFGGGKEPESLSLGMEAPVFELPDMAGERRSLAQYRGQPLLLVFFNPECRFCRNMVPMLAALARPSDAVSHSIGERKGEVRPLPIIIIITTGDAQKTHQLFAEHGDSCPVVLQNDGEVENAYRATGTPSGYLVSAEGTIASQLAVGAEAILLLMERKHGPSKAAEPGNSGSPSGNGHDPANRFSERSLARSKIKRDGLKAGTPAPDFSLPRLDGAGELSLSSLRGHRVLLVFSSPDCGPCQALAPELEKFHREHREIQLVLISKGEPKENRAKVKEFALTFAIALQQQWEISRRYAMFATPVAYLINEEGSIARDVAVGVDAILALLTQCDSVASKGRQMTDPSPDVGVLLTGR
jgi:peroxiredoxin